VSKLIDRNEKLILCHWLSGSDTLSFVMAGLDPAIHVFVDAGKKDVDARVKRGHDER